MPKVAHYSRVREKKRLRPWKPPQTRPRWLSWQNATMAAIVLAVVGLVGGEFVFRAAGCNIKRNISAGGERIYHVPGQEYYDATRINWLRGERWFCSEEAAQDAGWRKARI